jgi:hypothetical protein
MHLGINSKQALEIFKKWPINRDPIKRIPLCTKEINQNKKTPTLTDS